MRLVIRAQVFSVSSQQRGEAIILLLTLQGMLQAPALPQDMREVGKEEGTGETAKVSNWMPAGENS